MPRILQQAVGSGPSGLRLPSAPAATQSGPAGISTLPAATGPWSAGLAANPFTAAQLQRFSSLVGASDQPPGYLIPIYKDAGRRYGIPWQILAAINAIETDYGRDLSVSAAGAIGWMQFVPGTWLRYGVAADGRGQPNPYDPRDAVFSAARLLAANGGVHDIRHALLSYNHALWYVDAVMWRAQTISDHAIHIQARKSGYALPP